MPVTNWVQTLKGEMSVLLAQKSRATPSPKIFNLKDDGDNAAGEFVELDREGVVKSAQKSVVFLKEIRFVH